MRDGGWVKSAVGIINLRVDGQSSEALAMRNGGLVFVGTRKSY